MNLLKTAINALSGFSMAASKFCILLLLFLHGFKALSHEEDLSESNIFTYREAEFAASLLAKTLLSACGQSQRLVHLTPKTVDYSLAHCILEGKFERAKLQAQNVQLSGKSKRKGKDVDQQIFANSTALLISLVKRAQDTAKEFVKTFLRDRQFFEATRNELTQGEVDYLKESVLYDFILCIKLFQFANVIQYEAIRKAVAGTLEVAGVKGKLLHLNHQQQKLDFYREHVAHLSSMLWTTLTGFAGNYMAKRRWEVEEVNLREMARQQRERHQMEGQQIEAEQLKLLQEQHKIEGDELELQEEQIHASPLTRKRWDHLLREESGYLPVLNTLHVAEWMPDVVWTEADLKGFVLKEKPMIGFDSALWLVHQLIVLVHLAEVDEKREKEEANENPEKWAKRNFAKFSLNAALSNAAVPPKIKVREHLTPENVAANNAYSVAREGLVTHVLTLVDVAVSNTLFWLDLSKEHQQWLMNRVTGVKMLTLAALLVKQLCRNQKTGKERRLLLEPGNPFEPLNQLLYNIVPPTTTTEQSTNEQLLLTDEQKPLVKLAVETWLSELGLRPDGKDGVPLDAVLMAKAMRMMEQAKQVALDNVNLSVPKSWADQFEHEYQLKQMEQFAQIHEDALSVNDALNLLAWVEEERNNEWMKKSKLKTMFGSVNKPMDKLLKAMEEENTEDGGTKNASPQQLLSKQCSDNCHRNIGHIVRSTKSDIEMLDELYKSNSHVNDKIEFKRLFSIGLILTRKLDALNTLALPPNNKNNNGNLKAFLLAAKQGQGHSHEFAAEVKMLAEGFVDYEDAENNIKLKARKFKEASRHDHKVTALQRAELSQWLLEGAKDNEAKKDNDEAKPFGGELLPWLHVLVEF